MERSGPLASAVIRAIVPAALLLIAVVTTAVLLIRRQYAHATAWGGIGLFAAALLWLAVRNVRRTVRGHYTRDRLALAAYASIVALIVLTLLVLEVARV